MAYEIANFSPGTNSAPLTLSLSGAAASVTWTAETLVTGTASGTFAVLEAIGNTITSPGTSFDNAPINFTSTPEMSAAEASAHPPP